jgi:hypothetical protein
VNRRAILATGAATLATTAVLFGATPASAASSAAGQSNQTFSIERVAVSHVQAAVESPDWFPCCNVMVCNI